MITFMPWPLNLQGKSICYLSNRKLGEPQSYFKCHAGNKNPYSPLESTKESLYYVTKPCFSTSVIT
jgi:hypothetical protein